MNDAATPTEAVRALADQTAWERNIAAPLRSFLNTEISGAMALLGATIAALVWANLPLFGNSYEDLWSTVLSVDIGGGGITGDLHYWINDGLMTFFFLVVGLEVRREFDTGELRDRRRLGVPALAAIGGMALPVAIYLLINPDGPAAQGWGIVMPTDTAFALGVLALAGSRMPARLRVFVLTVVIADDIGTLLVIAVAYTDAVSVVALLVSLGLLVAALAARRLGIAGGAPYLLLGLGMWVAMAKSGVHPTLAGVLIGLTVSGTPPARQELERASAINRLFREQPTPELARSARQSVENAVSSNERLQYGLHPWTSFLIVPLFALANAGIEINGALIDRAVSSPVTLGVVAGLVVGKLVGISAASALAAHPRLGRLPLPVELPPIIGASAVAGIGFTLSLFIADIALSGDALSEAKIGILAAAVISAALGTAIFRVIERMQARPAGRVRVRPSKPIIDLARPVDPSRDHVRGPRDAPVTLLEYGDYECGYCGRAEGMIRSLLSDFGDDLRYAWRHLPLQDVHPHAQLAAEAAEAAAAQGRFWPMHELLLDHQGALEMNDLNEYAESVGLDPDQFSDDLRQRRFAKRIAADVDSADSSQVTGTPSFFINGLRHEGAYDIETMSDMVRGIIEAQRRSA